TLTVSTDAKDTTGIPMAATYTKGFTTTADTTAPTVVGVKFGGNRTFAVTFSEAMDIDFMKAHYSIHVFNLGATLLPIPIDGEIQPGKLRWVVHFVLKNPPKRIDIGDKDTQSPYILVVTAANSGPNSDGNGLKADDAARDLVGNALASQFSQSFTCGTDDGQIPCVG